MRNIQGLVRLLVAAAAPIVLSANPLCNGPVAGVVNFDADLSCPNAQGIHVISDNVTINLNGHTLSCSGNGYLGSCQGLGTQGITSNGFKNVTINGPGKIVGFEAAIVLQNTVGSSVKNVEISGPASPGYGSNPRPTSYGVFVFQSVCPANSATTVDIESNTISNQRLGVLASESSCVKVRFNKVSDSNSDIDASAGITLYGTARTTVDANTVERNGGNDTSLLMQAGIAVMGAPAIANTITNNQVNNNCGDGILFTVANPGSNTIIANTARHNGTSQQNGECKTPKRGSFADLAERAGAGGNRYSKSNVCNSQTGNIPGGVCNLNE